MTLNKCLLEHKNGSYIVHRQMWLLFYKHNFHRHFNETDVCLQANCLVTHIRMGVSANSSPRSHWNFFQILGGFIQQIAFEIIISNPIPVNDKLNQWYITQAPEGN